jgi:hypothetical protein
MKFVATKPGGGPGCQVDTLQDGHGMPAAPQ